MRPAVQWDRRTLRPSLCEVGAAAQGPTSTTVAAMRIAVDGRHLAAGRGVARYTRALLEALVTQFPREDWRVFVPGRGEVDVPFALRRHRLGGRPLFGAAALIGRPRLDRLAGEADVVWVPAPAPVAVSSDVPYVLTV